MIRSSTPDIVKRLVRVNSLRRLQTTSDILRYQQTKNSCIKECVVCYENTLHKTQCNHPICISCYRRIININVCPYCRSKLIN